MGAGRGDGYEADDGAPLGGSTTISLLTLTLARPGLFLYLRLRLDSTASAERKLVAAILSDPSLSARAGQAMDRLRLVREQMRAVPARLPDHLGLKLANVVVYWSLVAFHLYNTVRAAVASSRPVSSVLQGARTDAQPDGSNPSSSTIPSCRPRRRTSHQGRTPTGSGAPRSTPLAVCGGSE
jgi:hypothetical protein